MGIHLFMSVDESAAISLFFIVYLDAGVWPMGVNHNSFGQRP